MDMPGTSGNTTELQQRNRELSILNQIAQALNRSIDLEEALRAALAQVAELLDLKTGWVWLLEEEHGGAYLAAAQNLPPGLIQNPALMEGSCYCLDTYQAGDLEGAANVNVVTCSRLKKLVDGTDGLRYHASIPLYAHGKELGVLNVASTDWRELSPADLRLLYTIGDLLSIAIERARLFVQSVEWGAVQERNRLAREIHDTLAQGLAGIALQIETADALLETGAETERVRGALANALQLTRANLEEARRSVLDLRAAPLEGRSLSEALAGLVENTRMKNEIKVVYRTTGPERPLPLRLEVGLYRIAQEALANIIQHAHAQSATVDLHFSAEEIRLAVCDDGAGFDLEHLETGRFGLIGINERVKLLGGELHLASEPGAGTHLEVRLSM